MDRDYEALKLMEAGEQKLKPGCWESLCSSRDQRLEDAKGQFRQAADKFKLSKRWNDAGECLERCAEIDKELKEYPADFYEEAAHCFIMNSDTKRAIDNQNKAIKVFSEKGQYASAADLLRKLAENYENNADFENAITHYARAVDYYNMESSNNAQKQQVCMLKQADLMCISNHKDAFVTAKEVYEGVGRKNLDNNLTKASAKDSFTKCVILYLAYEDYSKADAYLSKFLNEDLSLRDTREHQLLSGLIQAAQENSLTRLKEAVTRYRQTHDIDKWKLEMLNRIRAKIEEQEKAEQFQEVDDFL